MSKTDSKTPPPPPPPQQNRPVVNPTPKQRLMNDGALLAQHRSMMQNPFLLTSLELAQAQYFRTLAEQRPGDGYTCASNFQKITGVHEFIAVLKSLGESSVNPTPNQTSKIDHKA